MWAMMTLLEVLDCSFSDNLVHRFSAPVKNTQEGCIDIWHGRWCQHISPFPPRYDWLPCSSLTAHTMRSTQAALAWQRSLRGLGSPCTPPVSWSTRCSSDWLLLNCSRTKSCTSRTKPDCKAETQGERIEIYVCCKYCRLCRYRLYIDYTLVQ